jgi:ribonucleoside-diphosphate reductase alpha chain
MLDYNWLNSDSRTFLSRGYLKSGTSAEERIRSISERAEEILKIEGFADKFELYVSRGWYSKASPVWCNFGMPMDLPISCNGQYIGDSMDDILYCTAETGMMTKYGAGTSAFFGGLRPRGSSISRGGESFGAVHFMQLFEKTSQIVSQSNIRRGSFAAYYPVDGKDIEEFLEAREDGNPIQDISLGVCISDDWMRDVANGDKNKEKIWRRIIRKRFESGYPYIFWSDTVNNNKPQVYKDKNMTIYASNLCTEIALPSTEREESFVCDLSSMNLLHYDQWKDTDAIEVLTYFLDAVMTEYIEKTKDIPFMRKAHNFAKNHRALGVGGLGWHSYLQSNMIPYESFEAKLINTEIWKLIQKKTIKASREMAVLYGEPELLKGTGMRNSCLQAIAPTTSSSFILGQVSPSIEPLHSNYFVKDVAKGKFTYKNPYLKEVLKSHKKDNKEVWKSILVNDGSVQHLDFLTDKEKFVFKTFGEISQKEIIIQAAARQKYIDQAQSINLMIHKSASLREVSELMFFAWESGVKTLYYQRGTNPSQELARSIINHCVSCEA